MVSNSVPLSSTRSALTAPPVVPLPLVPFVALTLSMPILFTNNPQRYKKLIMLVQPWQLVQLQRYESKH
jgi:hypothetical protein